MEEKILTTKIRVYSYNELSDDDKKLVDMAKNATSRSYVPYSHFHVGAAIRLENGEVVVGANQENAAFPSTMCGERAALYNAVVNYPGERIAQLAIAARDGECYTAEPVTPCGSCRQAIMEYEHLGGKPIDILLCGDEKIYRIEGIKSLLPLGFVEF